MIEPTKLLIDADLLVWRCGKAAEKDPVEFAKYNVRSQIDKIIGHTKVCEYECYISGSNNFRYKLATLKPYKENRKKLDKPRHYELLRKYLVDEWNAIVVEDQEADDQLGIEQMKYYVPPKLDRPESCTSMIVSIDKDMLMIPGWHYNFVKKTKVFITEVEGYRNFYKQVLLGDTADNIPGLKGWGPVAVKKLLDPLKTIGEMMEAVHTAYKNAVDKDRYLKLKGATVRIAHPQAIGTMAQDGVLLPDVLEEIKQLLWIRRV